MTPTHITHTDTRSYAIFPQHVFTSMLHRDYEAGWLDDVPCHHETFVAIVLVDEHRQWQVEQHNVPLAMRHGSCWQRSVPQYDKEAEYEGTWFVLARYQA